MTLLDVSIVIPTYNESEALPDLIPKIHHVLSEANISHEIIVVDDNSPDNTGQVATALGKQYPVRALVRTTEKGLATAVIAGFKASSATAVVVMDADGSHPVTSLADLIRPILEDEADLVIGSRYLPGGDIDQWPIGRQWISRFAGVLTFGLTRLSDPTTGFMAARRALLVGVSLNPVGWKIVLEIAVKLKNYRTLEIPITFVNRTLGKSKLDRTVLWTFLKHLWILHKHQNQDWIEFFVYCGIGFVGMFVDLFITLGLIHLGHFDIRLTSLAGFVSAVTVNYGLNQRYNFRQNAKRHQFSSYFKYVSVCSVGLLARLATIQVLLAFTILEQPHQTLFLAVIGIGISTLINFSGAKWLVFRDQ